MKYVAYSEKDSPIRVTVLGKHENSVLTVAVARCSKSDNYDRRKGLALADLRLQKGRYFEKYELSVVDNKSFKQLAKGIISQVEKGTDVYHKDLITKLEKINSDRKRIRLMQLINKYTSALEKLGGPIEAFTESGSAKIIDLTGTGKSMQYKFANPEE